MRPPPVGVVGVAVGLVALLAVPAGAEPAVVGYTPPRVTYGALAASSELAASEVHAQGLVVENLEPTSDPDTDNGQATCPPEGCDYQLVVADAAAVRAAADGEAAAACGAGAYAVVDADPDVSEVDGARLYTARGSLPAHTVETATAERPRPVTPGVGQLCFAATTTAADGEPVAVTQPVPVVILSTGRSDSDRRSTASPRQPHGHPAQRAVSPLMADVLGDRHPSSDWEAPLARCVPRRVVDILAPTTAL